MPRSWKTNLVCFAGLNSCHVDWCNYSGGYRPDIQPSRLHLGLNMCNQHCHVFAAHTSIEGQHRWAHNHSMLCAAANIFSCRLQCFTCFLTFWPSGLPQHLICINRCTAESVQHSASMAARLVSLHAPGHAAVSHCTADRSARQVCKAIIGWLLSLLHAGLSESSLLYHNNVLSLPLMASYMLTATNEVQTVRQYPQLNNIWFLVRQWKVQLLCSDAHPVSVPKWLQAVVMS